MKTHISRLIALPLAAAYAVFPQDPSIAPAIPRALASITENSLRGDVSFIASDLLEGRDTPSRGLDVAAEYISAQFRRAGLEAAGGDGYFQTAAMFRITPGVEGLDLHWRDGTSVLDLSHAAAVLSRRPIEFSATIYKVTDPAQVNPDTIKNKVVAFEVSSVPGFREALARMQPSAMIEVTGDDHGTTPRLIDRDQARALYGLGEIPRVLIYSGEATEMLRQANTGDTGMEISIKAPAATPVLVRNVAAWLRGSDPVLRGQYILLTAHYDHIGRNPAGAVYPGANDDGSGVASVIEIAQALSGLPVHPKRSIVFAAFFGEEEGDLGSRYYTSHPLFPLANTVADLNLEQVGRTDTNSGPEIAGTTMTGFRYSTIPHVLQQAGGLTGVTVHETANGDNYFDRSDNETFAEHGIPAHTLAVAFEFPDYHSAGDIWQKIDYANMARVDRAIALGLVMLADDPARPEWNRDNPKVKEFANAK